MLEQTAANWSLKRMAATDRNVLRLGTYELLHCDTPPRAAIDEAKRFRDLYSRRTILFVDEVHRWNKAQQDALLPWVESGTIVLVGATTENPFLLR